MSDFSDYTEAQIVDWLVGGTDMPAAHGSVYVALHTGDPSDSGENNEVTASSYNRVQTSAGSAWNTSAGTFDNANDIEFPEAQSNWGTISHFSLWDGSSDTDNALAQSALDTSRDVTSGDAPVFRAGDLSGQVD